MARGWESKSVEAQIDSAESAGTNPDKHLSPAQLELRRQKESLLLSRTRILKDIEASRNPRYIKMLNEALAALDEKLSRLD